MDLQQFCSAKIKSPTRDAILLGALIDSSDFIEKYLNVLANIVQKRPTKLSNSRISNAVIYFFKKN